MDCYKMCLPFATTSFFLLQANIQKGKPPFSEENLKRIKNADLPCLLRRCWTFEPGQRPTVAKVVRELEIIGAGQRIAVSEPLTYASKSFVSDWVRKILAGSVLETNRGCMDLQLV